MKLAIIGGSNSLIKGGYVGYFLKKMKESFDFEFSSVDLLTVGGTNSLTGLKQLCATDVHKKVDVIIFEYALNDSASFGTRVKNFTHWSRIYEGVIRKATSENPSILFFSFILGQKGGIASRRLCFIESGIEFISSHYRTYCINFNKFLRNSNYTREYLNELYSDTSHFSTNVGTRLVGEHLASSMNELLNKANPTPRTLPKAIDAKNYSKAVYTKEIERYCVGKYEKISYENNMLKAETIKIKNDGKFKFKLSGKILMIDFISTRESSPIMLFIDGKKIFQNTFRSAFEKVPHKFLLSSIVPDYHSNFSFSGLRNTASISVIDANLLTNVTDYTNEAAGSFIKSERGQQDGFSLIGLLYLGKINI